MVRISGERAIEVDREMVFVNEPKPSDFIDVQNIIEEKKDVFSTDDFDPSFMLYQVINWDQKFRMKFNLKNRGGKICQNLPD